MIPRPPTSTLFPYTTLSDLVMKPTLFPVPWSRAEHDGSVIPGRRPTRFTCCPWPRSEEHTSELQSRENLVCRLLLEKKKIVEETINPKPTTPIKFENLRAIV